MVLNVAPGAYVALVAVELVDQPKKLYLVLVGDVLDKVIFVPCVLVCALGTLETIFPFLLYEIVYVFIVHCAYKVASL